MEGITYTLIYDVENRLAQIKRGSNTQAKYFYDGDGNRVRTEVGSTITTYVGNYLEWSGLTTSMKKYYYAGGQRVAMRQGSSTLYFLLTDHLGSTAVTATSGGGWYSELRYYPWGGTRYSSGTTPTSYRYTGQREAEVGLYFYNARFYDPSIVQFNQPDTLVPDSYYPGDWNRYSYVRYNALRYSDPSGHVICGQVTNLKIMSEEDCPAGALDYGLLKVPPIEGMTGSNGYHHGTVHVDKENPGNATVYHPGEDVNSSDSNVIQATGNGYIYFFTSQARGELTGFGYYAILEQPIGEGKYYYHIFAHMESNNEFGLGQGAYVLAGTPIGIVGCTCNSSGNHIHWEIRID